MPLSTRAQLHSNNSSTWSNPILYSNNRSGDFPLSLTYNPKDERFHDMTENSLFFPIRTGPDAILELLTDEAEEIKIDAILKKHNIR